MCIEPTRPHAYPTQPTKQQAQQPGAAALSTAQQKPPVVTISQPLSAEAIEKLRAQQQELTAYEAYLGSMGQQLKMAGQQTKEEQNKLKVLLTCMEIARRISGGDKVPPADHAYLLKHDAALYARSVSLRLPKQNPHEYKRLSEEEPSETSLETGGVAPSGDLAQVLSGQAGQPTGPSGE